MGSSLLGVLLLASAVFAVSFVLELRHPEMSSSKKRKLLAKISLGVLFVFSLILIFVVFLLS